MLFVAPFGLEAYFNLPFVSFCCSSLLILVFEIESVLPQKPKEANAFGYSFWLSVARFVFVDVSIFMVKSLYAE